MAAINVIGVVQNEVVAGGVVGNLRIAGFEQQHISVIEVKHQDAEELDLIGDQTGQGVREVAARALKGVVVGLLIGIVAGFGVLMIPGVGPIAGPGILIALFGFSGAFVGGLAGAFSSHSVSNEVIERYGMALREGQAIIMVTAPDEDAALVARDILLESGAANVNSYLADNTDLAESPNFEDVIRKDKEPSL